MLNVIDELEGFNNFGIIDYNNFCQINIFINKKYKTKYLCYNNCIRKISNNKIIKIEENSIKEDKSVYHWDLYFLKKKRKIEN